jgi:hypothetical protein
MEKKGVFILLAVITIFMVVLFGLVVKAETKGININEGWNLIAGNILEGNDKILNKIYDIYAFMPESQVYTNNLADSLSDPALIADLRNGAWWAWADNGFTLYTEQVGEDSPLYEYPIYLYWNFIPIRPEFIGKNLDELAGNCNLPYAYWWNSKEQKWEDYIGEQFTEDKLWTGLVVYSEDNCDMAPSQEPVLTEGDMGLIDLYIERRLPPEEAFIAVADFRLPKLLMVKTNANFYTFELVSDKGAFGVYMTGVRFDKYLVQIYLADGKLGKVFKVAEDKSLIQAKLSDFISEPEKITETFNHDKTLVEIVPTLSPEGFLTSFLVFSARFYPFDYLGVENEFGMYFVKQSILNKKWIVALNKDGDMQKVWMYNEKAKDKFKRGREIPDKSWTNEGLPPRSNVGGTYRFEKGKITRSSTTA